MTGIVDTPPPGAQYAVPPGSWSGSWYYNSNDGSWHPTGYAPGGGIATPTPSPPSTPPEPAAAPTSEPIPSPAPATKVTLDSAIKDFAGKYGISNIAAAQTVDRYLANPYSAEFNTINAAQKADLARFTNLAYAGGASSIYRVPAERKLAPYISNGELDVVAAVKNGVTDPNTFKAAGYDVSVSDINQAKDIIKVQGIEQTPRPNIKISTSQVKSPYFDIGHWTADDLINGKVDKNGLYTPPPWGVSGTKYTQPPDWALEKIFKAQNKAAEDLKPFLKSGATEQALSKALASGNYSKAELVKMRASIGEQFIDVPAAFKAGKVNQLKILGINEREINKIVHSTPREPSARTGGINIPPSPIGQLKTYGEALKSQVVASLPDNPSKADYAKAIGSVAADMIVPFYYTATNWDSLSLAEKIIYLSLETASVIPIFWLEGRAISAEIRAGATIERALARAAAREALSQITAPYMIARHPLETVKAPYYMIKEIVGKRTVPIEAVIGSIRAPATKEGMSDVRMAVKAGMEEAGATRQAMAELQRALVMNEKPEAMQGLRLANMTPTYMQRALESDSAVHVGPALEKMLPDLAEKGKIVVEGKEGGLYGAGTGALFYRGAALGGTGQIKFAAIIDLPKVSALPRQVAGIKEMGTMERQAEKILATGIYADKATESLKIYRATAEGEVIISDLSELLPVTGPAKTFKWIEPDAILTEEASKARTAALQDLTDYQKAHPGAKEDDIPKGIKEDLLKADELDKEAIKQGIKKEVKLKLDTFEMRDVLTGDKVTAVHLRLPGVEEKSWTTKELLTLKKQGFMNIPRDIVTPALKYPRVTPEETITRIRERLAPNQDELARFDAGLRLSAGLSDQSVATKGLKLDFTKIKMMPNAKAAANVEAVAMKWSDKGPEHFRFGGSTVEQLFTNEKVIAGDADTYARPYKEVAEDFRKAYEDAGVKTELVEVTAAEKKGGQGYQLRAAEDIKGINQDIPKGEIIQEVHDLKYHMNTPVTSDPSIVGYGMKYGMPPIKVNGIYYEPLGELFNRRLNVLLFPGFGPEGTYQIGPEAAYNLSRLKDVPKAEIGGRALIDAARAEGKDVTRLERDFDTLMKGQIPETKTSKMVQGLRDMGYAESDIGNMPVAEAMARLGAKDTGETLSDIGSKVREAMDSLEPLERVRLKEERLRIISRAAQERALYTMTPREIRAIRIAGAIRARGPSASRLAARVERVPRVERVSEERGPRPLREERLQREERAPKLERKPIIERALIPERTVRPPQEARVSRAERPTSGTQPLRAERLPRGTRPSTEIRPPRQERPPQEARPSRTERLPREGRPPRIGRPPREKTSPRIKLPGGGPEQKDWTPGEIKSAVAFVMGKLKVRGGKLEPMIVARKEPYRDSDVRFFIGEAPEGMRVYPDNVSAFKTIQLLQAKRGDKVEFTGKQGFARYSVQQPSSMPGRRGAIKFGADKRIPDQTKKIAERLGSGMPLRNLSRRRGRLYKTSVAGGKLLSRSVIKGK